MREGDIPNKCLPPIEGEGDIRSTKNVSLDGDFTNVSLARNVLLKEITKNYCKMKTDYIIRSIVMW